MSKAKFGQDPIDIYSVPTKVEYTKLSRRFTMQLRAKPEKPGRTLGVLWDARRPLIKEFTNNYSYAVTFGKQGDVAGNHYHKEKQELFYPLAGDFTVFLENINTKEREELPLTTESHQVLYIKQGIAHVVCAKTDSAILLVTASSPGTEEDEYSYKIL